MKLKKLFERVDGFDGEIEIKSIVADTKEVTCGSLFFCLVGSKFDGHDYAVEANKKGASAVVAERIIEELNCPCIIVEDTRKAYATVCSAFYGHPETKLKIVGITGTNGKTTTAYITRNILRAYGKKVGMIGTNGIFVDNKELTTKGMTTPDPPELFRSLSDMEKEGVEFVVMEVSAHALALDKVEGINFAVGAFTNFSQDHLDYFETMEKYAAAKLKLFDKCSVVITNMDDEVGRKIASRKDLTVLSYGLENPADVFAVNERFGDAGIRFVMNICDDILEISSNLAGKFNIYNIMCASLICRALGVNGEAIVNGVRSTVRVDGRFNVINTAKYSIIIDFAHTENGLYNALSAIRQFNSGRIITVFGCGGDRDRSKRKNMGNVASSLSDYCILTSDNPRSEAPEQIIGDIEKGISNRNYSVIVDRRRAIKRATEIAQENDIIFIAGKGAEKYQEIDGVRYEYNDEEFVSSLIDRDEIK